MEFNNNKDDMVPEQDIQAGTLVICPTSVLAQWAGEVESKVASNTLKVYIFHGPNRSAIGLSKLRRMDLVINIRKVKVTTLGSLLWSGNA